MAEEIVVETPAVEPVAPTEAPAPVAEPVVKAKPTEDEKREKLSASYARLARDAKAAKATASKLAEERTSFETERQAALAEIEAVRAAKAEAKRFPLKFLESHGLTYQDLVDAQLNDGQPTPNLETKQIRDELEAFKRETAEREAKAAEAQKTAAAQAEAKAIADWRSNITAEVTKAADKFELVNLYGVQGRVSEVIEAHWAQQIKEGEKAPKLLSVAEAAEAVESALEAEALKAAKSKRLQAKLAPAAPAAPKPVAKPNFSARTSSLSNALTASAVPTGTAPSTKLTAKEREARAMAALNSFH